MIRTLLARILTPPLVIEEPDDDCVADAIAQAQELRRWAIGQASAEVDRDPRGDKVLALAERYIRFVVTGRSE